MDQPIVALDIAASSIKLIVGYELQNDAVVLYAASSPLYGAIVDGKVTDAHMLAGVIRNLIADASGKLKMAIDEVVIALPAVGLEIYESEKTTNVVSMVGRIERIDITNVLSIVRKENLDSDSLICGIIPEVFTLENGKQFVNPPLGENSDSLTIRCKIHVLPRAVYDGYMNVCQLANVKVAKVFLENYALVELLRDYKDVPSNYLLLDIGDHKSTLSFVAENQIYSASFFFDGGRTLTDKIAAKMEVPVEEAMRLKELYGYDLRDLTFKPKITKSLLNEQKGRPFFIEDLRKLTRDFLEEYATSLEIAIKSIEAEQDHNPDVQLLPLVITGGGAKLNGLKDFLQSKLPSHPIKILYPHSIGARNPIYGVGLGLIKAFSKYRETIGDERIRVTPVSRDDGRKAKGSASDSAEKL